MMRIIIFLVFTLVSTTLQAAKSTLQFSHANATGPTLTIAAVGDVLLHKPLQAFAYRYGFARLWKQAEPYIRAADIAFANVEGPMAAGVSKYGKMVTDPGLKFDNFVYSSYPRFNYHPDLAKALKRSGFDIVSIANNHSLDRFSVGVDKTLQTCRNAGLQCIGGRERKGDKIWYRIIHSKGFSIAWISCTATTNGIRDTHKQILYCYKRQDRNWIVNTVRKLHHQVDAIIISPHWGDQYSHRPNGNQVRFAKQMLNAGATAIIGSHPHVVQPIERYLTQDGRETLIAYSLGNFVSFQGTPKNRSTVIMLLKLVKTHDHGTVITRLRLIPAYMENRSGFAKLHLRVLDGRSRNQLAMRILKNVLPTGHFH